MIREREIALIFGAAVAGWLASLWLMGWHP